MKGLPRWQTGSQSPFSGVRQVIGLEGLVQRIEACIGHLLVLAEMVAVSRPACHLAYGVADGPLSKVVEYGLLPTTPSYGSASGRS